MQLPYSEELNIEFLSRIFDNKSESYKLFWFQAIVNKIIAGKHILIYDELINEMIVDAWYMVAEYKLNLGPSDTLETLILYLHDISGMKASEKKSQILDYLNHCQDKKVLEMKRTLIQNVPYRLQAPFMVNLKGSKEWNVGVKRLIEKINQEKRLIYYFSDLSGLSTTICIESQWYSYIIKNQEILKGWIQFNLIMYLQRRNPNVPGIASKLNAPLDRKLGKVIKYWKTIMEIMPIRDIFGNEKLTIENLSIDHFIPWSYVAHDEFWNLHPTTKSINSSKSNNLPDWNTYFKSLCVLEYQSYEMMWQYKIVYDEFKKCSNEHVNSDDVRMKLYRPGLSKDDFYGNLEGILLPVYESARNVGFRSWVKC
jgi:hypothetical protein